MSKTTEAAAPAPGPSSGRNPTSLWRIAGLGMLGAANLWTSPAALAAANPAKPQAAAAASSRASDNRESLTKLPSAAALRPSGPVTITARRAELVQGDSAVYVGNVRLDSNTLHMDGDRLELKQFTNGGYEAKITGTPGHMSHPGTGIDDPALSAHAKTLIYNSTTGGIDLIGDALFKRGDDQVTAETIHYELTEKRIQANGGESGDGQVHFILQAPPAAAAVSSGAAPANTEAPAPATAAPAPAASPALPTGGPSPQP